MKYWRIKLSLFINYFVMAILLNSVGTVILMVQNNFGVSEGSASVLEGFKDLPIAITSFLVASFIVRIGYKRAMLIALALIAVVSLLMPSLPFFWMTKVLFMTIGIGFALIKVSVYATIGLISDSKEEHASFMNFIESFYMVGVLSGYFVFTAFIDNADPLSTSWMHVYYLLSGLCVLAFILLVTTDLDESAAKASKVSSFSKEFTSMLALIVKPLILVFIVSIFLYVLIEQSIMTWLPTFNSDILNLPTTLSIQMVSILAATTALGRFGAGFALKKIHWYKLVTASLVLAAVLVVISMPLANEVGDRIVTGWRNAPLAAFVFPMIGLCLAPVYPAINSVMLSALPMHQHAPMSGLIVVFSALGGTTGSMITGNVFEHFGGQTAFYFSLLPIAIIIIALYFFRRETEKIAAWESMI
jgi:MFS transporter, FHS family, glucose/mannose:H+ symporter